MLKLLKFVILITITVLSTATSEISSPIFSQILETNITTSENDSTYYMSMSSYKKIVCGDTIGSGTVISKDLILTAYHVIYSNNCKIDGVPIQVLESYPNLDLSIIKIPTVDLNIKLNCNGFIPGEYYIAIGYKGGYEFIAQRFLSIGIKISPSFKELPELNVPLDVLIGRIYPGMSGGPVINNNGEIVGIVTGYSIEGKDIFLSRSLNDTHLCK